MRLLANTFNPEYVVIGHITQDVAADGFTPGGTALYAGLTAQALGLNVGILSAHRSDFELPILPNLQILTKDSAQTTRFKNINSLEGRVQYLYEKATDLTLSDVPAHWRGAHILHLGPVACEVDPLILKSFPDSLICMTPQGWMRDWGEDCRVHFKPWERAAEILPQTDVACMSLEDVQNDESIIEFMAAHIKVMVVTEAQRGARVYWNGDMHRFGAPQRREVDVTGAGDIFAASFFIRYYKTRNPWEAARFANQMASASIERQGLASIPDSREITIFQTEIIEEK